MTPHATLEAIGKARIMAVVRASSAEQAITAALALQRGGISAVEIAYTTPGASEAIRELRSTASDLLVGAGTVLDEATAETASAAGARFLVSPGLIEFAPPTFLLCVAGAFTPTEVAAASRTAMAVKLFPAHLGGPRYLRSLRGPYPATRFIPTGGVTDKNLGAWLRAGAFAVGAGTDLSPSDPKVQPEEIEARARRYTAALVRFDEGVAASS